MDSHGQFVVASVYVNGSDLAPVPPYSVFLLGSTLPFRLAWVSTAATQVSATAVGFLRVDTFTSTTRPERFHDIVPSLNTA